MVNINRLPTTRLPLCVCNVYRVDCVSMLFVWLLDEVVEVLSSPDVSAKNSTDDAEDPRSLQSEVCMLDNQIKIT